jgi:dolichol-phosphate mannosyltransferase
MKKITISIVICAKNEAKTIGDIIAHVRPYGDEILLIDGHSIDETRTIAESLGARIFLDHQKGKGDAIKVGITHALGSIIVFIDADGSHEPTDIPRLTSPILENKADLVIGSRSLGGSDEAWGTVADFIRNVGGHLIVLAINYRFNVRLTDSQNGFRAIKTDVARSLTLRENITTIEQEMLMQCLKRGYRVQDVPSHEYRRKFGSSRFQVWKVAHRYVWSVIKNFF